MTVKILAVAGDPGGANAILPVIRLLDARGVKVISYGYGSASNIFQKDVNELPEKFDSQVIKEILITNKAQQ